MSARSSLLVLTALVAGGVSPATAVPFAGVANVMGGTQLIGFDTAAPSATTGIVTVTGLRAGESVSGIDTRPATGELYALAGATVGAPGNLYTINPATGAATFVATTSAPITGSSIGFAFDPAADAIRIVGENDQSLRVSPVTGATVVDSPLAYVSGDVNAGANPFVGAVAYTNQDQDPATGTQLYGIDLARGALVLIDPPNSGVLTTVGSLGVSLRSGESFDIVSPTAGFVTSNFGAGTALNSIDLRTGAATLIGVIGPSFIGSIAQVPIGVPEPASMSLLGLGLAGLLAVRRRWVA